jgi:hypothetical protein
MVAICCFGLGLGTKGIIRDSRVDTWTDVAVLKVYDPWDFLCQFMQDDKPYGEPFKMTFAHDGSDLKLGLDPGMEIKRIKFANTPHGMSVAASSLGVVIHRDPATGKFIDFRGEAWTTTTQSQR